MTQAEIQAHLRFVRRHTPEPTRIPHDRIFFKWPSRFNRDDKGVIERRRFSLNGNSTFWAWTFDGKTPLFPEYDENDDSVK